mgnify:FL=1
MIKILIADDEINIREVVKEYGKVNGYEVLEAEDGQKAIDMVDEYKFDLIILDIMMPKLDGYTAGRQIKAKQDIPVIMLSARQEEADKLFGFELGIDDYMTKPFSPKELMARIKVILDRKKISPTNNLLSYQDLSVDIAAHEAKIGNEMLKLTNKEFELLVYFLKNRNIALTRDRLLDDIWGYDFYGDERTIDTHVKMLRQSIGEYGDRIITVRGVGYKFNAD